MKTPATNPRSVNSTKSGIGHRAWLLIIMLLIFSAGSSKLSAAVKTSVLNTAWSVGTTWNGGTVPVAGDDIIIATNVMMDVSFSASSFTINASRTLTGSAVTAFVLTVNANFINNGTYTGNLLAINVAGTGTNVTGTFTNGSGGANFNTTLTITSGTVNMNTGNFSVLGATSVTGALTDGNNAGGNSFTGAVTVVSGGSISTASSSSYVFQANISNAGTINKTGTGSVTLDNGITISGAGAITIAGSVTMNGATTVSATSINFTGVVTTNNNLTDSNTSGTVSYTGGVNVAGNMITLGAGTTQIAATAASVGPGSLLSGNLTVGAGSIFRIGNGAFTVNGTTSISGPVDDNGNSAPANTFIGAVTINATGSYSVLNPVSGTPTVFGSTLSNAGSFTNTSGAGTVTFNGNITNTGTFTKSGASAITFNNTTIFSSTAALSLNGAIVVNGNTTISAGANSFTAQTTVTANGDFTLNAGAVTFSGTFLNADATTTTINSAAVTFTGAVTSNGNFAINNTGTGTFSAAFTLGLGSTGLFAGPGASSIAGAVLSNGTLTINSSIAVSVNSTVTVGAAGFIINKGTVTFTSTSALNSSASSNWTNDANSTLNYQASAAPMNNGFLDATALGNTVNYNGVAQTVKQTTYHHISFAGSGTKTIPDIIVNGNFNRSAGPTLSMSGGAAQVIRFEGSSNATFAQANVNQTYSNIIVDKNGGSLTMVTGGPAVVSTFGSLTVAFGSFNMGVTGMSISITNDLNGTGNINMSGATHQLTLNGLLNSIGSLTSHVTPSLGTVTYGRAGDQSIFASNNYNNLIFSGGTGPYSKTLNGPVGVFGTLTFSNNSRVILGSNDFKLKSSATLTSPSAFGVNKMFVTDGAGNLIKEGTTAAHFTTNMNAAGLYPVGNSGSPFLYTPYEITSLIATVTATGTVSVKAVPGRQPNVPYYNNALIKYWDVETANISGITATFRFTFINPQEVIGAVGLYEARLWNGSSLILPAGASPQGSNPVVITGGTMLAGDWTAMDPTIRTTLYSYQSGDWATANTWTIDPSGSTLVSPIVPGSGDQVVILNGRTVSTSVARTVGTLNIENGGVLDLNSTTGHNFGIVSGQGLLRLSSVSWPVGTFTSFVGSTGGTVEYYDLPASSNLSSQATYNNLLFTNSTAVSYTVNSIAAILTNGNLSFSRTGAGTLTFNLSAGGAAFTYNVIGDVSVGAGCTLGINAGATNQHTFRISKNLTVDGNIDFQNGVAYSGGSGRAILDFQGPVYNATATFNSGSNSQLFTLTLNKNEGYELYVSASPTAAVLFNGVGELVDPILGTMRLGPNITVPILETTGGNYNLGFTGLLPVLWIDGANVTFGAPGGAIVAYGTLKITSGSLSILTGQASMVLRESGLYQQDGGTSTMYMLRTSNTAATHRGSFVMTGGTMTVLGLGGPQAGYACFTLPFAENVFKMSGGTINLTRQAGFGIPGNGGIIIASTPQNYDVTGGTVNVNVTGANGIDICSTAPFFNLNIGRVAGATGVVRNSPLSWSSDNSVGNTIALPGQPLTVLNDLSILTPNSPVFQGNGLNVVVGRDFAVNTGSTFTPGAGTLIFNGSSVQAFTLNGTLTAPGIGNLTVSKTAGSTLTVLGAAVTVSISGNLNLLSGTLNDGGKTIQVAGNITNDATHLGTGKIALTGTVAQVIGGNGNGQFQELEVAGTAGAGISSTNTIRVNEVLNFTVNRILNISINKLILAGSSTVTSTSGSFSNTRFISTDGFQSDGGIVKTFSSTAAVLFPFGTGTNYTPASIQFSIAPTTWGTLDVRPVASNQLYITDPDAFDYYWKVRQTGFSGVSAGSVNHIYNYGSLTDNTNYIPGYYNYQAIAFTSINDITRVDEPTNEIRFTGVGYFNGDFTAGVLAAFGTVVPYYSRINGPWNVSGTWSNAGFGGAAAGSIPNATVPVFIGDGVSYFHTITVPVNNVVSGSLIIDAGSTLDVGVTMGHNFGALPYSTAGGAGKMRISSSSATAEFPAGDFGLFFMPNGGTTEYYSAATDFTIPLLTAAPTGAQIRTYRNLVISPGAGRVVNMPNRNLEIYEDFKVAGNAAGIAAFNEVSSRTLTVRRDVLVTSGILRFKNNSSQSIIADQNITIGAAGTFDVENTGSRVHTISVAGNLTNNGTLNFNQASDINITFIGNINKSITGSNATAVTSFNNLILNKGTSNTVVLNVDVAGTLTAPTNNWLQLQNGSFRLAKAATLTLNDQPGNVFFVPSTSGIIINNPSAVINAGMANDNNSDFSLGGLLQITNGTMNIGNSANLTHNDLEYSATDVPKIVVDGNGILNVNGQIRRSVNVFLGSVEYIQKDNSIVLVRGRNPEAAGSFNLNRAKFEITNTGSSFTMQDNALLTIDRTGQPSGIFGDVFIEPALASVTGGEVRIGTGNTPISQIFTINANTAFWDLTVDGTTTSKTARIISNPVSVKNDLSILGNSNFDAGVYDVTIGGDLVNMNTTVTDGIGFGGYRVGNLTQVTTFSGTSGNQTITGTAGNLTNFGNVVINNTTGNLNASANTNLSVNANLSVIAGDLNCGTNNITVDRNIINNNSISNTGVGYFILGTAASPVQTLDGDGSGIFVNVRMNNPAGVDMIANNTINGIMQFSAGNFYINNRLLTFGVSATIAGTTNASSMIRVNGVVSDAGVRKLYPSSAHDFTFPIGVTLKYTPVRINVTSNTATGTVTVKSNNDRHPATTDPAATELTYYWNTSSTGFTGSTLVNHTYTYVQSDANGNEGVYRPGRYFNNVWTPQFGIVAGGSVNSASNIISVTGANYFDGDFTAGEQNEFDQLLYFYSITNGNWNAASSWSTDQILQHTGAPAAVAPSFNSVVISPLHTITSTANNISAPTAQINGTLNLGNTIGHNLGSVTGTGIVRMTPTGTNQFIFPGGNFSAFTATGGGTIEYNSTGVPAVLPTQSIYNNITFSGAGTKNLANIDLLVNGNLLISAGSVNNVLNKNINLKGNYTNTPGVAGFTAGAGTVQLTGTVQALTGSTNFYRLHINGAGVKTLGTSMSVTNQLNLTAGIIQTGLNQISLAVNGTVINASAASYVAGSFQKFIAASTVSKQYEIGDINRYTPLTITFVGTTNNSGSIMASTTAGDHSNIAVSTLDAAKSVNRTWTLFNAGVTGFTSYNAVFNFVAADVDGGANTSAFSVGKYSGAWTYPTIGTRTSTSVQFTGATTFGDFQVGEIFNGTFIWNGSVSQDWHNPGNWTPSIEPGASDNIRITLGTYSPSFVTPGNGFCKNITFNAGTSITVPAGYTLFVSGNWAGSTNTMVNGGGIISITGAAAVNTGSSIFNGVLNIASGASLATNGGVVIASGGSLMHGTATPGAGGSVTGNVIIRRTGSFNLATYNFWASPISNGNINSLGANRYIYNPNDATGNDTEGLKDGWVPYLAGAMTPGRGYIAAGTGTASFNGLANNGPVSFGPMIIGAYTPCNLIGNPYPSAINATTFVTANPSITGGAIYLWDDDNTGGSGYAPSDYGVWNGLGFVGPNSGAPFNGHIASGQGFFIEASSGANINFSNNMRSTANQEFFEPEMIERLWMNVTTAEGDYNETLIAFKGDATDGADQSYDAKKLRGNENLAFFSRIDSEDFAIQALGALSTDKTVMLGLEATQNGPQIMKLKRVDNIDQTAQIILEDVKLGLFHNLRNNPVYTYDYDKETDANRFRLHFKPGVVLTASTESCASNDGAITIHSSSASGWNYNISNSIGQSVAQAEAFTGTTVVEHLPGGIYTVELTNNFGTLVHQSLEIASGATVSASINASETTVDVNEDAIHFHASYTGATDITWNFGDGTIVTGEANPTHLYTSPGTYVVTFIASNANCMDVKTIEILVKGNATGIYSMKDQVFSIFPNPATFSTSIRLNLPEKETKLVLNILDGTGRLVMTREYQNPDRSAVIELEVSGLSAGVYQLLLNGKTFSTSARLTVAR